MDYNIYIHADSVGTINPTMPWGDGANTQTMPWETQQAQTDLGAIEQFSQSTTKAITSIGSSKGMGSVLSVAKAHPYIAAALAVVAVATAVYKTGMKIANFVTDYKAQALGEYNAQIELNNFANGVHALFSPVETLLSEFKLTKKIEKDNIKKALNRNLLGDSVINAYTRRGV